MQMRAAARIPSIKHLLVNAVKREKKRELLAFKID